MMVSRREGEDQAGQPHPHPESLLEGAGGGVRNCVAVHFAEAFQQ